MGARKELTLFNEDGSMIGYFRSFKEAAEFLEVNQSTITRFLEFGVLPVFSHPKTDKGYLIREGYYQGRPLPDLTRSSTKSMRRKERDDRKTTSVKNRVNRKGEVYQWDFEGNLVGKYTSGTEASSVTGISRPSIYQALNPNSVRGEACGFLWSKSPNGPKQNEDRKPNAGSPANQ